MSAPDQTACPGDNHEQDSTARQIQSSGGYPISQHHGGNSAAEEDRQERCDENRSQGDLWLEGLPIGMLCKSVRRFGIKLPVLTSLEACFGAASFGWDSGVIGGVIKLDTFIE